MSTPTIDVSFVEEFEAGVHVAYQRMGSAMRNTVRSRNGVKNKTTFQKYGVGSATQKARHGMIPPMNPEHTNVNVTLEDWYAGDWVDSLDELRINHDEKTAAMNAGAYALGRKTDEQITTAAETTTKTADETTNGATIAWATDLMASFGNTDVPDDGQRFAFVDWNTWAKLLVIPQFASADYVAANLMPFDRGSTAKRWLTFMWIPFSGLNTPSANQKTCLFWHRSAIGHAIGADVQSSMQYYNTHEAFFVNNKMQMNAVLIDENGCYKAAMKTN